MTDNQTDPASIASAYVAAAANLASSGAEWARADGQLAHAQVLATLAVAESILAVVAELRAGVTTYPD